MDNLQIQGEKEWVYKFGFANCSKRQEGLLGGERR